MSTALADEPKLLTPILHTLQDLRHLPGYAGFKPQCKWRYGDTFGNDTAKYFQQRRSVTLQRTSKDPGVEWDNKIQFPAVYSNDPKLVIGARTRERDRWLAAPKYALFNRHDRDEEIKAFHTKAQMHRQHFVDKSGTVPRVEFFVTPTTWKTDMLPPLRATKRYDHDPSYKDQVSMWCPLCGRKAPQTVNFRDFIREHHTIPHKLCPPMSTWRDRQLRDVYFERR